ncbi:MAG: urease accessory protein [Frondihabitans sp.]|nr:urease accessory protein [Frondihabitans sp.]
MRSVTEVRIAQGSPRARVTTVPGVVVARIVEREKASATVALVAGGAVLLGGDDIVIRITVGDGCSLRLDDIGGTVAYSSDGRRSSWHTEIVVGRGAHLDWRGLPFVVCDGADVDRRTRIRLDRTATALVRESLVWGRVGELGGRLVSTTVVEYDGVPLLVESLEGDGRSPVPGVLGRHRVVDSLLALGFRPERPSSTATFLPLEGQGGLARYLGDQTHESGLDRVQASWAAPQSSRNLATRSPTTTTGIAVVARGTRGMIDASATRSPSTPCTRPSLSTTAAGSVAGPILQVPTGCQ